ncbi:MAG: hypothetical protein IJ113_03445 [Eggerthellaceae bacterium]|nr:hypothetical protein [Eggerthellaceae bacterium]MBQ9147779.1 hypothetical protein [Rikenellaceae bacterium]
MESNKVTDDTTKFVHLIVACSVLAIVSLVNMLALRSMLVAVPVFALSSLLFAATVLVVRN